MVPDVTVMPDVEVLHTQKLSGTFLENPWVREMLVDVRSIDQLLGEDIAHRKDMTP